MLTIKKPGQTSAEPEKAQKAPKSTPVFPQEKAAGVLSPLVAGSGTARALYEVWNGRRLTLIDSAPGSGKTTSVCEIVHHLREKLPLGIVVLAPTRRAVADIAYRLGREIGTNIPTKKGMVQMHLSGGGSVEGSQIASDFDTFVTAARDSGNPERDGDGGYIYVTTIASAERRGLNCHLMIVDEAYQATYASLLYSVTNADQVLLVGDPGQIGPVVEINTSAWNHTERAPHLRAPEVMRNDDDFCELHLDETYRLGPDTVSVIQSLYDFPISSARPNRYVLDDNGDPMPEIETVQTEPVPSPDDMGHLTHLAQIAHSMVGRTCADENEDGTTSEYVLKQSDIAVVVAHNVQARGVQTALDGLGSPDVMIGTADSLQGGQWRVVIAADPMLGHDIVSGHQLSAGRLCVMLSRHTHHLVWVHDARYVDPLEAADDDDARRGLDVRAALMAFQKADV